MKPRGEEHYQRVQEELRQVQELLRENQESYRLLRFDYQAMPMQLNADANTAHLYPYTILST